MSRSIRCTGRLAGGGKMAITNDTARREEKRRDDARGDSVIFKLGEILHRIIAFDVLDSWLPTSAGFIHELVTKSLHKVVNCMSTDPKLSRVGGQKCSI